MRHHHEARPKQIAVKGTARYSDDGGHFYACGGFKVVIGR